MFLVRPGREITGIQSGRTAAAAFRRPIANLGRARAMFQTKDYLHFVTYYNYEIFSVENSRLTDVTSAVSSDLVVAGGQAGKALGNRSEKVVSPRVRCCS